ncbi:DUF6480 family protein [Rhodococcus sp. NPDC054953]
MTTPPPDPDPARTPDLEPGGGVQPGATPPESAQTSGLSAPEPRTRKGFPGSGIGTLLAVGAIVVIFVVVIVALVI